MLLLSVKKPPSFIKSQKISVRSSYMLRDLLDNFFIRLSEALEKKDSTQCLTDLFTKKSKAWWKPPPDKLVWEI